MDKKYSVDVDGVPVKLFETIEQAEKWIFSAWWHDMATIYDLERREIINTYVRI